ncbi:MAG: 2,3-cyclic 3-phosphodiesterase [Actinomycetota bacterium]|nr:2,3-cyclic 3-phosphodiesterase [Actinomycetota bacterium]
MTRAFVAVQLPHEVLDAVFAETSGLKIRGGRTMTRDQWHLTLQFLGDDADIEAVVGGLDGFSVPGGDVRLGGAGAFPSARRGRVLWIGLAEGSDVVARLARGVGERLAPLGYEPEARVFRPHLTIVRCANPTDLRAPIVALDAASFGPAWRVHALTVYESRLRPEGARYVERATVPLPG